MHKAIYCDLEKCTGCGACAVACMDENNVDISAGEVSNRRIQRVEHFTDELAPIYYISVSCMHCEDSPCLIGCPTGAIYRDSSTHAVVVNSDLCIGCHSCALACPFGVPRYDSHHKLKKCDLCTARQKIGLSPACVRVCPATALVMMDADQIATERAGRFVGRAVTKPGSITP